MPERFSGNTNNFFLRAIAAHGNTSLLRPGALAAFFLLIAQLALSKIRPFVANLGFTPLGQPVNTVFMHHIMVFTLRCCTTSHDREIGRSSSSKTLSRECEGQRPRWLHKWINEQRLHQESGWLQLKTMTIEQKTYPGKRRRRKEHKGMYGQSRITKKVHESPLRCHNSNEDRKTGECMRGDVHALYIIVNGSGFREIMGNDKCFA